MPVKPGFAQEEWEIGAVTTTILVMRSMEDYPPGLIGTISALFGRTISASHGVNWTLDAMIAEEQCKFFRRFDPRRDRVWVAMENGAPRGALTIDGSQPEGGDGAARLRFFILDESLRGRGLGRSMLAHAMQFCRERAYQRLFLTTLPGLEAAARLYSGQGFREVAKSQDPFHGSDYPEITFEIQLG
ncbi:GNAT family N-acetyltransferase [Acidobacteria bacterium AB60]|nr:GNAT family N-acetyltransferase [Acidobacteria bacterium AB60]